MPNLISEETSLLTEEEMEKLILASTEVQPLTTQDGLKLIQFFEQMRINQTLFDLIMEGRILPFFKEDELTFRLPQPEKKPITLINNQSQGWVLYNYEEHEQIDINAEIEKYIKIPKDFLRFNYEHGNIYITADYIRMLWTRNRENYEYPNPGNGLILESLLLKEFFKKGDYVKVCKEQFHKFTVSELVVFYNRLVRVFGGTFDFLVLVDTELRQRINEVKDTLNEN